MIGMSALRALCVLCRTAYIHVLLNSGFWLHSLHPFFSLCTWIGSPSTPQYTQAPKHPSKPGAALGHDIETSTGLGTHKSARAYFLPSHRPHLALAPLFASAYLASVTSVRTALSEPPALALASSTVAPPRVTDLTESTILPVPVRSQQNGTTATHPEDRRPDRCMCFFRPSHLPSPPLSSQLPLSSHRSLVLEVRLRVDKVTTNAALSCIIHPNFRRRRFAPRLRRLAHDSRTAAQGQSQAGPVPCRTLWPRSPPITLSATESSRRLNKHSNSRTPTSRRCLSPGCRCSARFLASSVMLVLLWYLHAWSPSRRASRPLCRHPECLLSDAWSSQLFAFSSYAMSLQPLHGPVTNNNHTLRRWPRPPLLRNCLDLFRWRGGKIRPMSRRLSCPSRPAKVVEACRLTTAHWMAGLCTRTCETGQTTLPHHYSAQGRPTHITSHLPSLTASRADIPVVCLFGHCYRI